MTPDVTYCKLIAMGLFRFSFLFLSRRCLGLAAEKARLGSSIVGLFKRISEGFLFSFLFVGHRALLRWVVFFAIFLGSLPEIPETCKGWDCDTVYCPDGYAVRLPDGRFLPCEEFDKFIDGDESVAVGGK